MNIPGFCGYLSTSFGWCSYTFFCHHYYHSVPTYLCLPATAAACLPPCLPPTCCLLLYTYHLPTTCLPTTTTFLPTYLPPTTPIPPLETGGDSLLPHHCHLWVDFFLACLTWEQTGDLPCCHLEVGQILIQSCLAGRKRTHFCLPSPNACLCSCLALFACLPTLYSPAGTFCAGAMFLPGFGFVP